MNILFRWIQKTNVMWDKDLIIKIYLLFVTGIPEYVREVFDEQALKII